MFDSVSQYQTINLWLNIVAIPYFFALMGIELWSLKKRAGSTHGLQSPNAGFAGYELKDSLCSISMGALKLVTMGISFIYVYPLMSWLFDNRIFTLELSAWWFLPALIVLEDFCYYWYHRVAHRSGIFWAEHSNHHTSHTYNLSTALRQSVLGPFVTFVFWIPLPLLGFDPLVIALAHTVNLLYQYWIHTEVLEVHGWYEKVFNCPQHHRLHHAKNEVYHDCNYGGIFILWDRLFGTYRDYVAGVAPEYGTVTPVTTKNPFKQAIAGWQHLIAKMQRTRSLSEKVKCLVMPPGWEPRA